MVSGIRFMSPRLAGLHRALVWAWQDRRRVQAWSKDATPEMRRHYLDAMDGRVRSALADLRDALPV